MKEKHLRGAIAAACIPLRRRAAIAALATVGLGALGAPGAASALAPSAVSDPVGYVTSWDGYSRVVYRGLGGSIHELYQHHPTKEQGVANLSTITGAPVIDPGDSSARPHAYVTANDSTARVIYRAEDKHIHELAYTPDKVWRHADLNVVAKAATATAVGNPFGYVTKSDGYARVVYRSADNHIHELSYKTGSGWHDDDLTNRTGAPTATGDPKGFESPDNAARVVYRGTDQRIHQLEYKTGAGWKLRDPVGTPLALSDPVGYARWNGASTATWDGYIRIVYRGTDGYVHELYSQPQASNTGWQDANLSTRVGAPRVVNGPPNAYVTPTDNIARVIYRADNDHIHELAYTTPTGWTYADLTAAGKAPTVAATGVPSGFAPFASAARVVYRAGDGNIRQLAYQTNQGWSYLDLTDTTP